MIRDSEVAEDRAAELGYRETGQRELAMRDWLSLRGEPGDFISTPRGFAKVVNRLRVRKWKHDHPDRRKANGRRWWHEMQTRTLADRTRRNKMAREPVSCIACGVLFCSIRRDFRGGVRLFCMASCQSRAAYLRRKGQGRQ